MGMQKETSEPAKERFWHAYWSNRNYRLALLIALLASAWLASGLLTSTPETARQQAARIDNKKTLVKARYIDATDYQPEIVVRARTAARRSVVLKAELSGRVVKLAVAEGSLVAKGDLVCELATEDKALLVEQAESRLAEAQLEYDGALRLRESGYQSQTAIATAKANRDSARAVLKRAQLDLANTRITAPFAGIVDRLPVEIGDFMQRGDECGLLLDIDPVVIAGQVSETQVQQLRQGKPANARLLSGERLRGTITRIGLNPDPLTRGFPVEVEVDNPRRDIRLGITTDLLIAGEPVSAHVIPSSLLSLDDDGKVGVRILVEDNRVVFVNVSLVGDHAEGVWVTGLPQHALLVTVGQEYVIQGELVDVVIENEKAQGAATDSRRT